MHALAGLVIGIAFRGSELYFGVPVFIYDTPILQPYIPTTQVQDFLPLWATFTSMAVGIASATSGVKWFGTEKLQFWREASVGMSSSAYFVGKCLVHIPIYGIMALMFSSVYYLMIVPRSSYNDIYAIVLELVFCHYGIAYIASQLFHFESQAVAAVVISLVWSVTTGFGPTMIQIRSWHLRWFYLCSFPWWLAEGLYTSEVEEYQNVYAVSYLNDQLWGYTLNQFALDLGIPILLGIGLRVIAYILLVMLNQGKQH